MNLLDYNKGEPMKKVKKVLSIIGFCIIETVVLIYLGYFIYQLINLLILLEGLFNFGL